MDKAFFMIFDFALTMFFIILILFVGIFAVHLNQMNTFEDQSQAVVSRAGGFNESVQTALNRQAIKYYTDSGLTNSPNEPPKAMFKVEPYGYPTSTSKQYESVPYGGIIKYRVVAHIPLVPMLDSHHTSIIFNFSSKSDLVSNHNGEVQEVNSEARQGSQDNIG